MTDSEDRPDSAGLLTVCRRSQGSYSVRVRASMETDLRRGVCYIISHGIFELRFCCFGIKIRLYFSSAHNWTWQRDDTDAPNVGDSPPGPATAVSNHGYSLYLKQPPCAICKT